jgi:hypothetical protein
MVTAVEIRVKKRHVFDRRAPVPPPIHMYPVFHSP